MNQGSTYLHNRNMLKPGEPPAFLNRVLDTDNFLYTTSVVLTDIFRMSVAKWQGN